MIHFIHCWVWNLIGIVLLALINGAGDFVHTNLTLYCILAMVLPGILGYLTASAALTTWNGKP